MTVLRKLQVQPRLLPNPLLTLCTLAYDLTITASGFPMEDEGVEECSDLIL